MAKRLHAQVTWLNTSMSPVAVAAEMTKMAGMTANKRVMMRRSRARCAAQVAFHDDLAGQHACDSAALPGGDRERRTKPAHNFAQQRLSSGGRLGPIPRCNPVCKKRRGQYQNRGINEQRQVERNRRINDVILDSPADTRAEQSILRVYCAVEVRVCGITVAPIIPIA
jgi:hypothetical protein